MTPQRIISHRIINDHSFANGLKLHPIEVTPSLIKPFRSAHQKCMAENTTENQGIRKNCCITGAYSHKTYGTYGEKE